MAKRLKTFVVVIELTYDNGVVLTEVRMPEQSDALDAACEEFDIDSDRHSKFIRNWWVIEGTLS